MLSFLPQELLSYSLLLLCLLVVGMVVRTRLLKSRNKNKQDKTANRMEWNQLADQDQLKEIGELSQQRPVLIYKHSTRCSLSSMVKERLEEDWDLDSKSMPVYFLDILANRQLSSQVADYFNVQHQSPQILLIKNNECVFHTSHLAIQVGKIKEKAAV